MGAGLGLDRGHNCSNLLPVATFAKPKRARAVGLHPNTDRIETTWGDLTAAREQLASAEQRITELAATIDRQRQAVTDAQHANEALTSQVSDTKSELAAAL